MGAEPAWMTLSLSLPQRGRALARAVLRADCSSWRIATTSRSSAATPCADRSSITVQIGGWVETDRWLTRSGAQAGRSAVRLGHARRGGGGTRGRFSSSIDGGRGGASPAATIPAPRAARRARPALRTIASAAMDVSDGLLTDLEKLCAASGCGAQLDVDALPRRRAMRELFDADDLRATTRSPAAMTTSSYSPSPPDRATRVAARAARGDAVHADRRDHGRHAACAAERWTAVRASTDARLRSFRRSSDDAPG